MKQINVTTAMGKRLIGKGMAQHPEIRRVLEKGTLLIIAGSTNGYVAEEILTQIGQAEGFSRVGFRRGVTVAKGAKLPKAAPPCDVVIVDGEWQKGKTVFEAQGYYERAKTLEKQAVEGQKKMDELQLGMLRSMIEDLERSIKEEDEEALDKLIDKLGGFLGDWGL